MSSVSNNFKDALKQNCTICFTALDQRTVGIESVKIAGMQLGPESIAETPDRSVQDRFYHGQCLAQWMTTKINQGEEPKEPGTRGTLNGTQFYEKTQGYLVEIGKYSIDPVKAIQQRLDALQGRIDEINVLLERDREGRVRSRLDVLVREQNRRVRERENRIAMAVFAAILAGCYFYYR